MRYGLHFNNFYWPRQSYLESLVAGDERSQLCQRLFARAANANQKSVTFWRPYDSWDLDQIRHSILHTQQFIWTALNYVKYWKGVIIDKWRVNGKNRNSIWQTQTFNCATFRVQYGVPKMALT